VLFSAASGIFHPYYVSLLAPFAAALVGAGAAELVGAGSKARVLAPLAVLAGVSIELVIRAEYPGQLTWLPPVLIATGVLSAVALGAFSSPRVRRIALSVALAALLAAPAAWSLDTLGHAASGTFPAGGPASVETAGGPGGFTRRAGAFPGGPFASRAQQLFGAGGAGSAGPGGAAPPTGGAGGSAGGAPPAGATGAGAGAGGSAGAGGGAFPGGAPMRGGLTGAGGPDGFGGDDASLKRDLRYVAAHGGGTVAVSSQSSAAAAIIAQHANVAGIGGFSGRESSVTTAWLAQEVKAGHIRWVLGEGTGVAGAFAGRLPGDTRTGSRSALSVVEKVCRKVTVGSSSSNSSSGSTSVLYDCQGRAAQLASAGGRGSAA
jgi:hypothetical protein